MRILRLSVSEITDPTRRIPRNSEEESEMSKNVIEVKVDGQTVLVDVAKQDGVSYECERSYFVNRSADAENDLDAFMAFVETSPKRLEQRIYSPEQDAWVWVAADQLPVEHRVAPDAENLTFRNSDPSDDEERSAIEYAAEQLDEATPQALRERVYSFFGKMEVERELR